jgi:abequosyltransferase
MPIKMLTVVIPTYNRATHLSRLLTALTVELEGLNGKVQFILGDNASTDHTPLVINSFVVSASEVQVIRHSKNVGPDENFLYCMAAVKSQYVWIIGDDDLPKKGVLQKIVELLERNDIDLLYMQSDWHRNLDDIPESKLIVSTINADKVSRAEFARDVNVWLTFISGMIINLKRLYELEPNINLKRFNNTSLVQLGWVLPLLMRGENFRIIREYAVLATSNNTGGYKPYQVFAQSLPRITKEICLQDSQEHRYITRVLYWQYLPSLIWSNRFRSSEVFQDEDIDEALGDIKQTSLAYWLLIFMLKFPQPVVTLVYVPVRFAIKWLFVDKLAMMKRVFLWRG